MMEMSRQLNSLNNLISVNPEYLNYLIRGGGPPPPRRPLKALKCGGSSRGQALDPGGAGPPRNGGEYLRFSNEKVINEDEDDKDALSAPSASPSVLLEYHQNYVF